MNILNIIIEQKLLEISIQSLKVSIDELKSKDRELPLVSFKNALLKDQTQIIAEIKQKSPSEGSINNKINFLDIAKDYEKNGASSISVLTDKEFFGGSLSFLKEIKKNVKIPVLQKDFIISDYQIYQSYFYGADAILLISEALDIYQLRDYYDIAKGLGLEVLMEFHSLDALEKIIKINPEIIGVNSRNLETMKVNINLFEELFYLLPKKSLKVAESGIKSVENFNFIKNLEYDAALIGTILMKNKNPGKFLKELIKQK